jgi:hypothetical protein
MKRVPSILIALAMSSLLSACAVQAATAPHARSASPLNFDIGGRVFAPRDDGVYASTDLVLGRPEHGSYSLRHGLVGAGYRLLWAENSVELGGDLGVGQPVYERQQGTGVYLGGSAAFLRRLHGNQDTTVGYSPFGVLLDVVLGMRVGVWNPPDGDYGPPVVDASLLIGLRGSVVSDLVMTTNRNWQP